MIKTIKEYGENLVEEGLLKGYELSYLKEKNPEDNSDLIVSVFKSPALNKDGLHFNFTISYINPDEMCEKDIVEECTRVLANRILNASKLEDRNDLSSELKKIFTIFPEKMFIDENLRQKTFKKVENLYNQGVKALTDKKTEKQVKKNIEKIQNCIENYEENKIMYEKNKSAFKERVF